MSPGNNVRSARFTITSFSSHFRSASSPTAAILLSSIKTEAGVTSFNSSPAKIHFPRNSFFLDFGSISIAIVPQLRN